jgi:hypothetical protein
MTSNTTAIASSADGKAIGQRYQCRRGPVDVLHRHMPLRRAPISTLAFCQGADKFAACRWNIRHARSLSAVRYLWPIRVDRASLTAPHRCWRRIQNRSIVRGSRTSARKRMTMSNHDLAQEPNWITGRLRNASFLRRQLPYLAVLVLAIAGVAYTNISHQPLVGYWEFLVVATGVSVRDFAWYRPKRSTGLLFCLR